MNNLNYNIEEINRKLDEIFLNETFQIEDLILFFSYIERKLRLIELEESNDHSDGLRTFQQYIQKLKLEDFELKKLSSIRNEVVHGKFDINNLNEYSIWIKEKIFPEIITLNIATKTPSENIRNWEKRIIKLIKENLNEEKLFEHFMVEAFGNKYRPDIVFELTKGEYIIFELRYISKKMNKSLKSYLRDKIEYVFTILFKLNSKIGFIIVNLEDHFEKIIDNEYSIFIIGSNKLEELRSLIYTK